MLIRLLVILSPILSSSALFYIPSHVQFILHLCLSLPASRGRSPACSRLCAISPYFSLVNIWSQLSSMIFIPKEGPVSHSGFNRTLHCETSPFQRWWQSVCTFLEGFWSENADQDYDSFFFFFFQQGFMKKAWIQTVVSWNRATDDKLNFKCCPCWLLPLWPYR